MARLPRLAIDKQLHHLVHRAAPGQVIFLNEHDRSDYLAALLTVSRDEDVAVHAYAVLPDRVHMLLTPRVGPALATMMQRLGRRYVGAFNARHGRSGTPWAGRYRVTVLQAEPYFLDAMQLVETAGMTEAQGDLQQGAGNSLRHHLGLHQDPLVTEHRMYWTLGNTPFEREAAYRRRIEVPLQPDRRSAIIDATEKGWVLGDAQFVDHLSDQQARRLLPKRRGRPRKVPLEIQSGPNK